MTWDVTASTFQGYLASGISLLPAPHVKMLEAMEEGERQKKCCLLPMARLELYHVRWYERIQYRHNLYTLENRRLICR